MKLINQLINYQKDFLHHQSHPIYPFFLILSQENLSLF